MCTSYGSLVFLFKVKLVNVFFQLKRVMSESKLRAKSCEFSRQMRRRMSGGEMERLNDIPLKLMNKFRGKFRKWFNRGIPLPLVGPGSPIFCFTADFLLLFQNSFLIPLSVLHFQNSNPITKICFYLPT